MAEGVFPDSTRKPVSAELERELGRSWQAWQALGDWLSERFSPLTEEWRYAGAQWGWSLRVKRKKRTILYLLPCRKYFRVTLILGEKAVQKAQRLELPEPVLVQIRDAKKYPEGRVLRFEIRFKRELPAIEQLVGAKMSA
jgi:hypothetical protein